MALQDEINAKRKEIRTDGYQMSIGEWVSLYESGEIDIHPEFQRFFRWSESQKTSLIGSILLGIPMPPIFVSQRSDGIWDVVDGLQRLSTIYELFGILKDETGNILKPLTLESTKYLPSLGGKQLGRTLAPARSRCVPRCAMRVWRSRTRSNLARPMRKSISCRTTPRRYRRS